LSKRSPAQLPTSARLSFSEGPCFLVLILHAKELVFVQHNFFTFKNCEITRRKTKTNVKDIENVRRNYYYYYYYYYGYINEKV
jgi:hypothetical protein